MPLTSALFKGNQQLQQCAVSDAAHIVANEPPKRRGVNDQGEHVALIQRALRAVMPSPPSFGLEEATETYGPKTAEVVRQFKAAQSPPILNKALGQKVPDNIVGKQTIAALDAQVQGKKIAPVSGDRLLFKTTIQQQSVFRKGTEIDVTTGDLGLLVSAIENRNSADVARLRRNTIEGPDFDDGRDVRRDIGPVPPTDVLRSVARTVRATRLANIPKPGGFDVQFIFIRSSRFTYGPGEPQHPVSVSTETTIVDSANVFQPTTSRNLHIARQPADPLDPR